jgi:hypothetical protein
MRARMLEDQELPEGPTRRRVKFALPPNVPPSYLGRGVRVDYTVEVHVSIAWWPDRRERFVVHVLLPAVEARPKPLVVSSDPTGPRGTLPHAEVSLRDANVPSGGVLRGALAFGNVEYHRYTGFKLAIVGLESVNADPRMRGFGELEITRYEMSVPVDGPAEGEAIPFAMRLPSLTPSMSYPGWARRWVFEVTLQRRLATDHAFQFPVTILPTLAGPSTSRPRHAPPAIGNERVRRVWQDAADRHGLSLSDDVLSGARGDVRVTVTREHRGDAGIFLVGRLAFPPLHLALDGGKRTGFRRILGGGEPLGAEAWDRVHYLTGREGPQVAAFARPLAPALAALALADLDDEHMVVERRDAGQLARPLEGFVGDVVRIAERLPEARAAIPAPGALAEGEARWHELAKRLGTTLERARMSVSGDLAGLRAEITTQWGQDGRPEHTEVRLACAEAIPERQHLTWRRDDGAPVNGERLPPDARAAVHFLAERSLALRIGELEVRADLEAPLVDPRPALVALEALERLRAALRTAHGPYR